MKEDNLKKEILTDERIAADLRDLLNLRRNGGVLARPAVLTVCIMAAIMADLLTFLIAGPFAGLLVMLGLLLVAVGSILYTVIRRSKVRRSAAAKRFRVIQDVLVSTEMNVTAAYWRRLQINRMNFSNCGEVLIYDGRYYRWSSNFQMSSDGICNTGVSGDTFYLVQMENDRSGAPVMVYNAKFFDYRGERKG